MRDAALRTAPLAGQKIPETTERPPPHFSVCSNPSFIEFWGDQAECVADLESFAKGEVRFATVDQQAILEGLVLSPRSVAASLSKLANCDAWMAFQNEPTRRDLDRKLAIAAFFFSREWPSKHKVLADFHDTAQWPNQAREADVNTAFLATTRAVDSVEYVVNQISIIRAFVERCGIAEEVSRLMLSSARIAERVAVAAFSDDYPTAIHSWPKVFPPYISKSLSEQFAREQTLRAQLNTLIRAFHGKASHSVIATINGSGHSVCPRPPEAPQGISQCDEAVFLSGVQYFNRLKSILEHEVQTRKSLEALFDRLTRVSYSMGVPNEDRIRMGFAVLEDFQLRGEGAIARARCLASIAGVVASTLSALSSANSTLSSAELATVNEAVLDAFNPIDFTMCSISSESPTHSGLAGLDRLRTAVRKQIESINTLLTSLEAAAPNLTQDDFYGNRNIALTMWIYANENLIRSFELALTTL